MLLPIGLFSLGAVPTGLEGFEEARRGSAALAAAVADLFDGLALLEAGSGAMAGGLTARAEEARWLPWPVPAIGEEGEAAFGC